MLMNTKMLKKLIDLTLILEERFMEIDTVDTLININAKLIYARILGDLFKS